MTTTRDVVERAYRKIALKSEDESITGDMLQHGVDTLNAMMHGWGLFGIDIGHSDLAATDDFSLGPQFVEGTIYQLANRLSPDFLVPAPDQDAFFRALQAAYMVIDEATIPAAIRKVPSRLEGRGVSGTDELESTDTITATVS